MMARMTPCRFVALLTAATLALAAASAGAEDLTPGGHYALTVTVLVKDVASGRTDIGGGRPYARDPIAAKPTATLTCAFGGSGLSWTDRGGHGSAHVAVALKRAAGSTTPAFPNYQGTATVRFIDESGSLATRYLCWAMLDVMPGGFNGQGYTPSNLISGSFSPHPTKANPLTTIKAPELVIDFAKQSKK